MSQTNPGVAAALSFLVSGLGQIYNGQIKKGLFTIFLSSMALLVVLTGAFFIIYSSIFLRFDMGFFIGSIVIMASGIIVLAVIGITSIFDAYNFAKKNNP